MKTLIDELNVMQNNSIDRYGNPRQQKKIAWPLGLLERKKKQQSTAFFDVIFYVYTHVDNRERAREVNFV